MTGVDIKYKGNSIASIQGSGSKTLKTQGKYCEGDILIDYVKEGITSSGSVNISTNGTHDVTDYINAVVAVPQGVLTCITATYTVSTAQANKNVTLISGNPFIAANYDNAKAFAFVVKTSGLQSNGVNMFFNTNQEFGVISSSQAPVYGWFAANSGANSGSGNRVTTQLNTSPASTTAGHMNANSNGDLIVRVASDNNALQVGDYFIIFGLME